SAIPHHGPGSGDQWDAHMFAGRDHLAEGRLQEAEQAFQAALAEVGNTGNGRRVETLTQLASVSAARQDSEQALGFIKEALDLLARLGQSTVLPDALAAAESVAEFLTLAGDDNEADGLWMRVAAILDSPESARLPVDSGAFTARGMRL